MSAVRGLVSAALVAAVAVVNPATARAEGPDVFGEPAVTTRHEIRVGSEPLAYTAEAGRVAIRNVETGEPHGYMFYVAYRAETDGPPRPITFVWNGGPGANSALLHFEAAGPRRLQGETLVDNQDTWLTATDLVFVDPVGTGFSRPAKPEYADEFYGTVGDVASVTEFVRAWRLLRGAEDVPVLLAGESWGAGRAGSVGYALLKRGVPVRALVLISGGAGLNREVGSAALQHALRVADRSATALYHGRLPKELGEDANAIRAEAEDWAREAYAPALERPGSLSDRERSEIVAGLARYSGIPSDLVDRETLLVSPRAYREGLLHDSSKTLDVFDMRLTGPPPAGAEAFSDRRQSIGNYLREVLAYRTDLPYLGTESAEDGYAPGGKYPTSVNARWNYATAQLTPEEVKAAIDAAVKSGGGPPQMGPPLPSAAEAVELDPGLRVLVAAGLYDSLNSCAANEEMRRQLEDVLEEAYDFECFEGGHMMYRDPQARVQLAASVRKLAATAVRERK